MPRFVALLRGVNVGKANRLPMAEFRGALEGLGYSDVATLRNSGNAVFTTSGRSAKKHAHDIAELLQATFDVSTPVIVKSAAELAAVIAANPMVPRASEHSHFLVAFANDTETLRTLDALRPLAEPPERLLVTDAAAYLHCPAGLLQSAVGKAMLGKTHRAITTRNWATVLKLAEMVGAP